MTIEEALSQATLSVPEAGAIFFRLSRNGSYEAAKRGELPTVRIGRKIVVPVALLAEKLGLRANFARAA
ncbi:MAG: helix-turn-helix domain-containing protein [Rhizobiaceae bacterium]|nr:helix-turn-helix domain-containing protein [Rhizobiaceae bacterium]